MQKIKMSRGTLLTFEEGCNKYLEYCRQRNLREGTIGHYRQSYTQFYKFFDSKMPIADIDVTMYKNYVIHLNKIVAHFHYGNPFAVATAPYSPRYINGYCSAECVNNTLLVLSGDLIPKGVIPYNNVKFYKKGDVIR